MKNYKRRLVFLFIILTVLLVALYFYLLKIEKADQKNQKISDPSAEFIKQSSEIHRIWEEGEDSSEWKDIKTQCLKKFQITEHFDETFLRCNPMLISCIDEFSKNKSFHLKDAQHPFKYINKENSNYLAIDEGGFLFELLDLKTNQTMHLLLKKNCQEFYLDQRVYGYGEMVKPKDGDDYLFDNFGQNIYIDKHLALNQDVNYWITFGDKSEVSSLKKRVGDDLFLPVTDLTLKQMENFCRFYGKELLDAKYFDAATFLPFDLEDKEPKVIKRSPVFWSKKSEKIEDCHNVFYKECLEKEKFKTNFVNPTWAGLFDSMGGVFEAFKNPIEPELNLKVSSFYLSKNSKFHRLGLRTHWDGEGFTSKHFDFKNFDIDLSVENYQVGFRCMRRVH